MPDFVLTKWYYDLVDDRSNAFIGYFADLQWGNVKLRYEGSIFFESASRQTKQRNNFRFSSTVSEIDTSESLITFPSGRGTWDVLDSSYKAELLGGQTPIHWECFQPKSDARLTFEDQTIQGFGYAEKITLRLAPWRLPIKELFWGRYHSMQNTVVWIRWVGPMPKLLIFWNGRLINEGEVTSEIVIFDGQSILLPRQMEIRNERIRDSLFRGFKKIMKLFPASIMSLQEEKWCGQAMWMVDNKVSDTGMVLHERVTWP